MKSKKLTNALFIVLLGISLVIASVLVRPSGNDVYDILGVRRTINQIKEEPEQSLDVLFIGDSLVYTSFAPLTLWNDYGFASFNAGTASQRICDSYAMLEELYDFQSPKLVVLDLDAAFKWGGPFEETDQSDLTLFGRILPILHYHLIYKLLKSPKELIKGTNPKGTIGYLYKGFNGKKGSRKYDEPEKPADKPENEVEEEAELASGASDYLEKIMALCSEHNTELLLVSSPSATNWDSSKGKAAAEWAEEHNAAYLDMNKITEIAIDWSTDTVDGGDHLNMEGSEKVTDYIGKYISGHYELPDHRSEEAYQSWNELYQNTIDQQEEEHK